MQSLKREYADRPAKDKKCVDILMYTVLFAILAVIMSRLVVVVI